jgi:uncharacterized protein (TIGR02147 family)
MAAPKIRCPRGNRMSRFGEARPAHCTKLERMERPNPFDYLDYRRLLHDYYTYRKQQNANFSHRYIAGKLGRNPAYFLKICQGKRNLSSQTALAICELFGFSKRETEYFESLVGFNQSDTLAEKSHFYEKIAARRIPKLNVLDKDKYGLYEKWYYVAIREILDYHPFRGDYKALGNMLVPPVKAADAKKAIEVLTALGLIVRTGGGGYRKVDEVISTGDEWRSFQIARFLQETSELGREAFDRFSTREREIGAQTVSVSAATVEAIRERIRALRREVLDLALADKSADRVYQINIHAFPLTHLPGKHGHA